MLPQWRRRARALARPFAVAAVVALSPVAASCSHPRPRDQAHDRLVIPEGRTASAWIARALRKEGFVPEAGRVVAIAYEVTVRVDIAARGEPWSVLWLLPRDAAALEGKLPPPPPGVSDGALWVVRGVDQDASQRVLVLFASQYGYDPDPRGAGVTRSLQEVEARTLRDVTDFLVRAKAGGVP